MRAYDIILRKREGMELSGEEIRFLIQGYAKGTVPDYQMAAFLMALFFRGLSVQETAALTAEMVNSGDKIDLSRITGFKVDKHSTGGVGDKTSLVLVPMVAAQGLRVVKMSGRGLGHTGGTIDKLECIPGFRTSLSVDEMTAIVEEEGAVIAAQTGNLVPADKKIYALRDVTATVDSMPLIASSVMSKKIAAGSDGVVLDVKVGSGAFIKEHKRAEELAELMVQIGAEAGLPTVAVISWMGQPLGRAVGNSLEIKEAVDTLNGQGPPDIVELCLELGKEMLLLSGDGRAPDVIKQELGKALKDGSAYSKLEAMVSAQGGDLSVLKSPERLPSARHIIEFLSPQKGFVAEIDAQAVGRAAMLLGAGRRKKEDEILPGVGIQTLKKVGEYVSTGDVVAIIHAEGLHEADEVRSILKDAYKFSEKKPGIPPLIFNIVKSPR